MISEDTKILVQEQGYLPVKDIGEGEKALWNGKETILASVTKGTSHPLLNIELLNGKTISATDDQIFRTIQRRTEGEVFVRAENLDKKNLLCFTEKVFDFDYLDLTKYKYLSNLNSEELGALVGLIYCAGMQNGSVVDLPKLRKEAVRTLESYLFRLKGDFSKDEYFDRTDRVRFVILDNEVLSELSDFKVSGTFPKIFWTSKVFMKGFLKSIFTFGTFSNEIFTIRGNKNETFLKDVQECLSLFGITSSYCRGMLVSYLTVSKHNCYRFAQDIGVFNVEILFAGVDFKKVLVYKDNIVNAMKYGTVNRVERVSEYSIYAISADTFMAGGFILGNI